MITITQEERVLFQDWTMGDGWMTDLCLIYPKAFSCRSDDVTDERKGLLLLVGQ